MILHFDAKQGLIVVRAKISGPGGDAILRMAVDTGATTTVVSSTTVAGIGYDPAVAPERVEITTGSGVEFAPRLTVERLTALGQIREHFPVLCHTLPPSAGVDGLVGLDFFRSQHLSIDFEKGEITLG